MSIKDLDIIETVNGHIVYSIGEFKESVPYSLEKLPPQFTKKIKEYCSSFKYSAIALPSYSFKCHLCKFNMYDLDFSRNEELPINSKLYWLKLDNSIYQFNGLLYHLVIKHGYIPPVEFVNAVMNPEAKTVFMFYEDEKKTLGNKEEMEIFINNINKNEENNSGSWLTKIKRFF